MTADEYLRALNQELKEFSPKEQASFIQEISSHIESYHDDKQMGKHQDQRRKNMMNELGSPQEMGKRFRMTYRPGRFIDYLLIVIPFLLYPYMNMVIQNLVGTEYVARLEVVLYSLLILLGILRQSDLLTLFWITIITTQITSYLMIGYSFYGFKQNMIWSAFAIGLIFLLARIVWKNRHDTIVVIYACLPLVLCAYGSIFILTKPQSSGALFGVIDRFLLNVFILSGSGNGGFFQYFGLLLAITLFLLPTNRDIRWVALAIFGLVETLSRTYLNLYQGLFSPWVYSLYVIVPLVLVFLGWWFERFERKQISLACHLAVS